MKSSLLSMISDNRVIMFGYVTSYQTLCVGTQNKSLADVDWLRTCV